MKIQSLCRTLILSLMLLPPPAAAAEPPSSAPSSPAAPQEPMAATEPPKVPKYPVSYEPPTAEQIERTLDRVRARLEAATGYRIVDSKTHQPIADLSKPVSGAVLDAGPERKFSSYSYPSGVIYNGMLLAGEVTGDKRYRDFVAKRFQMFADNLPALSSWPKEDLRRNPFRN